MTPKFTVPPVSSLEISRIPYRATGFALEPPRDGLSSSLRLTPHQGPGGPVRERGSPPWSYAFRRGAVLPVLPVRGILLRGLARALTVVPLEICRYDAHPMAILTSAFAYLGSYYAEANPSLQGNYAYPRETTPR